jgi:malonate-semialdehyde dehydrogenase (acetylating)/methylmalonate-semialdehyde dehydrogenase
MKRLFKQTNKNFTAKTLNNFINGEWVDVKSSKHYEIHDPSTQKLISSVPETPKEDFNKAVNAAKEAYKSWRNVPVLTRQRFMFDYLRLLRERHEKLAKCISEEHGKILPDSMGDVMRGIEVVEQACNVAPLLLGDTMENISKSVDMYSFRNPLGVCAGVCPFNFPVMIPLWVTYKLILDVSFKYCLW